MKLMRTLIVTLLLIFTSLSEGISQDSSQWALPENAIARIGRGRITDMAYSPDGKLLAVGTSIGTWLYDAHSGAEVALLTGYTNEDFGGFSGNVPHKSSLSFSPDGKMLASAYWDGKVRVWDVSTRKLISTIKGYWHSALFSPDGKILSTGDILWDTDSFKQISSLGKRNSGGSAFTFSPDGTVLVTGVSPKISLWNLKTEQRETIDVGERGFINSVVYSPDSTTLASCGMWDNTIRLWDPKTGEQKAILKGHTRVVNSVAYSPDGKTLASSCWDMIRLWDAKTGQHKMTIPKPDALFTEIEYTRDGKTLTSVSANGKIQLWDAKTGQHKGILTYVQSIYSMLPSPDGRKIATGLHGDLLLWHISTQQPKPILTVHTEYITPVLFSQDGTTITCVKSSMEHVALLLCDVQTGKRDETFSQQLKNVYSRTLSPDGKILALKIEYSTIQLWNTTTGEQKATLTKQQGRFDTMIFSPDSSLFVTRDDGGTIELWDAKTGQHKTVLTNQGGVTDALAFSPDGKVLACSGNNEVHLWDLNTGTQIYSTFATSDRMPGFISLAFSPDGTIFASGSYDAKIRLWNTTTGLLMDTLIGHTGPIESLMFLPQQKVSVAANSKISRSSKTKTTLASRSRDGTVLLWEVKPFVETAAVVNITPSLVESPEISEQLTLNVDIKGGTNVSGYQLTVEFDATALRYVSAENGDYLPSNTTLDASLDPLWMRALNRVKLIGASSSNEPNSGVGTLASVTFEVIEAKASTVSLPKVHLEKSDGSFARPIVEHGSVLDPTQSKKTPVDYTQFALPDSAKARLGKGTIYDIKFSPDNTRLAVASSIGIWLYDANTGDELALLKGHTKPAFVIAFSPEGDLLASGSSNGTLRLWNSLTYQQLKTFRGDSTTIAFSPDGQTLFNGRQLWNVHTGQPLAAIKPGNIETVTDAAFSPNGKTLATTTREGKIELWDVNSGQRKTLLYEGEHSNSRQHKIAFALDGNQLAAISSKRNRPNNTILLWNTHTGELLKTYSEKNNFLFFVSIDFSAEGELITVARESHKKLHIRNFNISENLAVLEGHDETIHIAAISPDKTTLASAGRSGAIRFWDIDTGKLRTTITGHTSPVTSIALSPDGSTLATGNYDQLIQLWDLLTQQHKGTIPDVKNPYGSSVVAYSPDNTILAEGRMDSVRLLDINTLQQKVALTGHRGSIDTVAFSPDGRTFAIGARYDKKIHLWNVHTGEQKLTLKGYTDRIYSLAFSPDGATIASAETLSPGEEAIRLWDTKTGTLHKTLANLINPIRGQRLPVISIAFSPDGKTVASLDVSSDVQLWDVETRKHNTTLKANLEDIYGYYGENSAIAFSPDGTTLVSTGLRSTINVWDVETGKHQKALKGHSGRVTSLEYTADGTTLASASKDGTVLLWPMKSTPDTRLNITPLSIESPPAGTQLTFNINMTDGQNVTGYQFTLQYDAKALRYIPNTENDPKIRNVNTTPPAEAENSITFAGKASPGSSIENGTIATVTFEVIKRTDVILTLTEPLLTHKNGEDSRPIVGRAWIVEPPRIPEDVNHDWVLDAADLEFVSSRLGQTGKENSADINGDGIVDIADLVLVRNALYGTEPESETD